MNVTHGYISVNTSGEITFYSNQFRKGTPEAENNRYGFSYDPTTDQLKLTTSTAFATNKVCFPKAEKAMPNVRQKLSRCDFGQRPNTPVIFVKINTQYVECIQLEDGIAIQMDSRLREALPSLKPIGGEPVILMEHTEPTEPKFHPIISSERNQQKIQEDIEFVIESCRFLRDEGSVVFGIDESGYVVAEETIRRTYRPRTDT